MIKNIPFLSFESMHAEVRKEVLEAIQKVYDSHWYVLGSEVEAFESEYAQFSGVKHCIGVANGLDALIIALKVVGVEKGDEVIVPSNTYIATWLAVSALEAIPIPVEPDPKTYNIDVAQIEARITKKTKAIIPVHLYGQVCEMQPLVDLANQKGLFIIEDNAQAQGVKYQNRMTGSFGHINAVSFYPGKNLGALGDGGAITTDNDDFAYKARVIRNYGSQVKYLNELKGMNSRLDELQAAVLRVKLKSLLKWNAQRVKIASIYREVLSENQQIILPHLAEGCDSNYHLFVIQSQQRNVLQEKLKLKGIGSMIHYPVPPHLQKAYQEMGYQRGSFPIAEGLADNLLSLPIFPGLSDEEAMYVAHSINEWSND